MNFSRAFVSFCAIGVSMLIAASLVCRAAEQPIQTIVKRTLPSVVSLTIRDASKAPIATGSGFVVGRNMIATNLHVVTDAGSVTANFQDGRSEVAPGLVVGDTDSDLAIVFVDTKDLPALSLANSSHAQIGDSVIALGAPIGLKGTASTGIISAFRTYGSLKAIQTTAPISHGSSGGPLLDRNGRVLGITSYTIQDGENLNFAISSFYLKPLISARIAEYWTWAELRKYLADQDKKTAKSVGADKPIAPAKDIPDNTSPKDGATESEAVQKAREEVRLHPKNVMAYVGLADALLGVKDYASATVTLRDAVKVDPKSYIAHFDLATSEYLLGNYANAIAECHEASRLDPQNANPHNICGLSLSALGKTDEETKEYRTAVRLNPNYDTGHHNLGMALLNAGKTEEAIFELREGVRLNTTDSSFLADLGYALMNNGQYEDAAANYRKAIILSPDDPDLHNYLGIDLYQLGKLDEAIPEYKTAIRLSPKMAVAYENLGLVYSDQGEYAEAITTLQKCVSLPNADADAHIHLGTALVKTGKTEAGRAEWKKALAMDDEYAKKKAQDLLDAHPAEAGQ